MRPTPPEISTVSLPVSASMSPLGMVTKQPFGQMDAKEWEIFASWMAENSLISKVLPTDELFTNELLPPETD